MTKDELIEKVSRLKRVQPVPSLADTFVDKFVWKNKPTFHFVRPVTDDAILLVSSQNRGEAQALDQARRLFDLAVANLARIVGNVVVRIDGFDSGDPKFDTFLALGPSVSKFVIGDGHFLTSRTTECFAINHIEFSGTETESEAVVVMKHAAFTDITREITPVTFGRYQKQTGQKSAPYLGVGRYESMVRFVKELPRDGGVCEFENWQRAHVTLTGEQGSEDIELTFGGQTKTVSVDDALKLLHELMYNGADAAGGIF